MTSGFIEKIKYHTNMSHVHNVSFELLQSTRTHSCFFHFCPKALQPQECVCVCVSQVDSVFHTGLHKPCHLSKHTDVALTCR